MTDRATARLNAVVKNAPGYGDIANAYVYGDAEAIAYIEEWHRLTQEFLRSLIVEVHGPPPDLHGGMVLLPEVPEGPLPARLPG